MKKALILTYYWPPAGGAGVQRWLKFVKYMRTYGWEPVVYTHENGEIPVRDQGLEKEIPENILLLKTKIWEPYSIYKMFSGRKKDDKINASFLNENRQTGIAEKISVWIRGNFFIPDARRFWIKPSIRFLSEYVSKNKMDVIISTGPPHSMHLMALGLKKKFPQLKWLADFRDPWTHIDFYDRLMLTKNADAKHRRLEKSVLREADIVLSVGNEMSKQFQAINNTPSQNKKFRVITNGFDEEDVSMAHEISKDIKFSLAHIGTLVKDRNPIVLWKVLKKLVSENEKFKNDLEIKLVGKTDVAVMQSLDEYGLQAFAKKTEYVPHAQVIALQKASKVLLLLINRTANAKGILTGKFFEYMASGVPVLAIGPPNGEVATILHQTQCGLISDFDDEESLEKNILSLYNKPEVSSLKNEINKYSRRELTKQLCQLLDEMRE